MSSGCGDVLSLEDLKTAKKHQTFEAEVITGKAGGVASGADIDYATNQVTGQTQKTLPAVLRDAGFRPASFTFTTGGTLTVNDADLAVLWPIADGGDGNYYAWKGSLPKTIPAASTPSSTGGVGSSAWDSTDVLAKQAYELASDALNNSLRSGAIVSGIQESIAASNSGQVVLTLNGDETVTSLSNDYGVEIDARRGRVFDTSGVQLTTYAEPKSRMNFGREYLWAIHKKLINSSISSTGKIVWSGDSTTNGVNAGAWSPHSIANNLRFTYGIPSAMNYNEGHNAKTMVDWGYWYVNQDITKYPDMDCYVLRWGINDGGVTSIIDFTKALRDGLTTLRNWKNVRDLSVILMMPNTTSDTVRGRDEKWYEQISGILRKAARDFKCMFYDTYGVFRDGRGLGPGAWLDQPYPEDLSIGIHPDEMMNAQIIGDICELLYGPCASINGKSNNFINSPSSIQMITSAYPPMSFPYGIGIYRTDDASATWPINGEVTVKSSIDGVVTQTVTGYLNNAQRVTYTRYGTRAGNVWSDFRGQAFNITTAMLSNGWTIAASRSCTYQRSNEGVVTINAMLVPGTVTAGTLIMTLPADYRPKNVISYVACGANNGYAAINILTNGQVQIQIFPASASVLTVNVTFPSIVV